MADHRYEMAKTFVFWDTVECKIPEGLEVGDVLKNIKMALEYMGYRGSVSITATGDGDAKDDVCSSKNLLFKHFPTGERDARLKEVLADVMEKSVPCNLLLIMKIPVDLATSLRNLNLRNLNLLGAVPDAYYPTGMLLSTLSSVWHWSSLSDGGNPITSSKTDVFWDMDDCPIPVGLDPDMIYQNITSALKDKGYLGEVSITAYGENQIEFQSSGVKHIHVPAGESSARLRIMVKLVGWALDNPGSNLMLIVQDISNNSAYMEALQFVRRQNCKVLLVQPEDATGQVLRLVSTEWRWTDLSSGGKPITQSQRKSKAFEDSVQY